MNCWWIIGEINGGFDERINGGFDGWFVGGFFRCRKVTTSLFRLNVHPFNRQAGVFHVTMSSYSEAEGWVEQINY